MEENSIRDVLVLDNTTINNLSIYVTNYLPTNLLSPNIHRYHGGDVIRFDRVWAKL